MEVERRDSNNAKTGLADYRLDVVLVVGAGSPTKRLKIAAFPAKLHQTS
jgi:hypothetical protein